MPETILLNDFKRQWADTGPAVLAAVAEVGASGWYVLGESVRRFEAALAPRLSRRFAVGCASGLDAIEIALRALELPMGAPVLTTPLSAFATTLAIVRAGGIPVFVDVDASGQMDLEIARRVLEQRPEIRFMVPVHLYGHALDLDQLRDLKERLDLRVVEDCAQAVGACDGGRPAGSVGDLAAMSFYPTKNLGALGDGGAVLGDDDALRAACASLRDYGQVRRYVHDRLGLNSRLDELQAALLASAFLPRLDGWIARRRQMAQRYLAELRHARVAPLPLPARSEPGWHLFPVLVPAADRDSFMGHLQKAGVQSAVHYPQLIPDQPALEKHPFAVAGEIHRARAIAAGEVSLPIHPYLTDDEVTRVIQAVNTWGPS